MIEIKRKEDCCGCNACGDVCPYGAISFTRDKEAFEYPIVDKEKCVDCHLCEKVCPIINVDKLKYNDYKQPQCHAAIHKNIETRFDSTSGGIFSALAEAMYKQGGYVGGAVWIESDWHVEEYISNNPDDLPRLRSSKYLQSLSEGFYKKIKELLKADEKVLVCGTPCQMAALRSYLNYKDYNNLVIVDFICLGVNSPKVWRRYLDYREKQYGGKAVYVKPKNKEMGWRQLTTKLVFDNGKVLYDTANTSFFTHGYVVSHAYCRPSCYECKFKGLPRIADISIADYWGGEKVVGKELDNDLGTSLVLVNSKKGEEFYRGIKAKLVEKDVPFESILQGNRALMTSLPKPAIDREKFYEDLDAYDFEDMAHKYGFDFKLTKRQVLKNLAYFLGGIVIASRYNPFLYIKNIWYNVFDKRVKTDIIHGGFVVFYKNVKLQIAKGGVIVIKGRSKIGNHGFFPTSNLETRLYVGRNARLQLDGKFQVMHGAEIQIFDNAEIHCEGDFGANIGANIICGNKIIFGQGTSLGRYVTIRDNNGDHYISRRGYKTSHTLYIGQHCWFGEGATVIGGAKLGDSVIVGAKSVVTGHYPSFTMISGNPAQVVDEDIYWKY